MSEEQKKSRRRRRRPRSSSRNKAKPQAKSAANEASKGERSSSSRRRRSRRRPDARRVRQTENRNALMIQQHTEEKMAPIDENIFIYTYTLRPRSLLDSYEAGPNVAEKMTFEQEGVKFLDK